VCHCTWTSKPSVESGSIERANQDVEHMLRPWMQDNGSQRWSIGLQFVQWQKNCSFHRTIGRSPYNALFGNDPKVGLINSRLPINFVKNITAEEEIKENVQCSTVNYKCHVCEIEINEVVHQDEAGSIMCILCRKK
jgi:hypothetical protein